MIKRCQFFKIALLFNTLLMFVNAIWIFLNFTTSLKLNQPLESFSALVTVYVPSTNSRIIERTILSTWPRAIVVPDDDFQLTVDSNLTHFLSYKRKYKKILQMCADGETSFCMIMEDDVHILYGQNQATKLVLTRILSNYGNYDYEYDCSKTGWFLDSNRARGNGLLCRIIAATHAQYLVENYDNVDDPADIALARTLNTLGVKEKRFKLVEHTGFKTTLQH